MDIFEDPDVKTTYDKCKYKVKLWEHKFKQKNGRVPSKLDIKEADREVRNAYKIYYRLKTAALEESLLDIEGFDIAEDTTNQTNNLKQTTLVAEETICLDREKINSDKTWGEHLNKTKKVNKKVDSGKLAVNLSFSQKLFKNSKTSKRLPRKSLSFNRKKSESNPFKPIFMSQPENSTSLTESSTAENSFVDNTYGNSSVFETPFSETFEETFSEDINSVVQDSISKNDELQADIDQKNLIEKSHFNKNYKINNPTPPLQSLNVIQSALNHKPVRTLDPGWIQRTLKCANESENRENVDYDSDDIIENSEDELEDSIQHTAKKRKVLHSPELKNVTITGKQLDFANIFQKNDSSLVVPAVTAQINDDKNKNYHSEEDNKKLQDKSKVYDFEPENEKIDHIKPVYKSKKTKNSVKSKKRMKAETPIRKSIRNRKTFMDLSHLSPTNDDPYHTDSENDPDFNIQKNNDCDSSSKNSESNEHLTKNVAPVKSKKSRKKPETITENSENDTRYELEFSVQPRRVSKPRMANIKEVVKSVAKSTKKVITKGKSKDPLLPEVKPSQAEQKLLKKLEAGTLNDNYVTINLKKKVYVRGKSNRSFSKYKKQQWKKKKNALYGPDMDMGGCDGGMLTCFKCGQAGHFARRCPVKGDSLLPLQNEKEEACPLPTLEEAAKIARESVLAVRSSNQVCKENSGDGALNKEVEANENDEDGDLLAEVERIEREITKLDVQNYIDAKIPVRPYFTTKDDGVLIETPNEVYEVLRMFGHQSFRPGQETAIMRILSGKSTLVTLSTGSGKSLCYQLPAYLYSKREPCISLIISPLVSLMEDQVTGIPAFLKAACLHTNQTKVQRDKVMEAVTTGELHFLLVSPEAVVAGERSSGFGSLLRKLPPIAFACIDEAHCVSQWSHNFRPSYLKICRVLRDRLGVNTILGLTATATRTTGDSIIRHLHIPDGRDGIISDIPLPENLKLSVSRDVQRDHALLSLLLSERFAELKSIIIYCTRREECQRVATFLRTSLKYEAVSADSKKRKRMSLQAECYHAGLSASRRKTIQKAFMNDELRIVVATVAFGMGINKSDIRAVIHYNMPMSFESYVQEVGRSGRDGLPAYCHLFLDSQGKDENELRRHIYANSIDRHVIRKLLQRCFIPCSCKTICARHEVAFSIEKTVRLLDIPEENVETLLCYLELHEKRYVELLSHAYVTCKVISYGGPNQIKKAAKDCPPLAMALALHKKDDDKDENVFEFPVIDVAAAMGWDSGICKHKLKNLEWVNENGLPKRSKLSVQFTNLGFRLLAPGNLSEAELDEALDGLYQRVKEQERTSLLQLYSVHATLTSVAAPSFKLCTSESNLERQKLFKERIREYFASSKLFDEIKLPNKPINEEQLAQDVRTMVCMYRDNSFTGRAMARIFHGIQSPNYPAVIWGRCKFWRQHMGTDFNEICQIATRVILEMK